MGHNVRGCRSNKESVDEEEVGKGFGHWLSIPHIKTLDEILVVHKADWIEAKVRKKKQPVAGSSQNTVVLGWNAILGKDKFLPIQDGDRENPRMKSADHNAVIIVDDDGSLKSGCNNQNILFPYIPQFMHFDVDHRVDSLNAQSMSDKMHVDSPTSARKVITINKRFKNVGRESSQVMKNSCEDLGQKAH